MQKLYPPNLAGILPAITEGNFTIPFSMNRSVSLSQVRLIRLKIKTVQNDMFLITVDSKSIQHVSGNNYMASFTLSEGILEVGMSYRFQLAYVDLNDVVGYYSTIGVAKYTKAPLVKIEDLEAYVPNTVYSQFIGTYSQQARDITEKEYNYRFIVYNNDNTILADTGYLLHNSANDTVAEKSHDVYTFSNLLEPNIVYYIRYFTNSVNGVSSHSPKYKIIDTDTVAPDLKADLAARNFFDNGYILLTFDDILDENNLPTSASGNYELYRSNGTSYELIHRFQLNGNIPSDWSYKDMTVEHGQTYQYFVKQYNPITGVYSSRLGLSKVWNDAENKYEIKTRITATFEDAFLFDGDRQLRIRYNPRVSSFKTDVLESKMDTLGGRTPYFFRNGNVSYKDFPISGLVSYLSDNEDLFTSRAELGIDTGSAHRTGTPSEVVENNRAGVSLDDYNVRAERLFKLQVLDWLNNGKPKLFRSPGEGNYLVRVMNSSMTPIDTVNRMLHTFNCNAYEVDDVNYENLFKYGIYKEVNWHNKDMNKEDDKDKVVAMQYGTLKLKDGDNLLFNTELITDDIRPVSYLHIEDAIPGSKFYLNETLTTIGATGTYHIELLDGIYSFMVPVGQKEFIKQEDGSEIPINNPFDSKDGFDVGSYNDKNAALFNGILQGTITYGSKPHTSHINGGGDFSKYNKVALKFIPDQQVRGIGRNILAYNDSEENDLNPINNVNFQLTHINAIKLTKLDQVKLYITKETFNEFFKNAKDGAVIPNANLSVFFFLDEKCTKPLTEENTIILNDVLYKVYIKDSSSFAFYVIYRPTYCKDSRTVFIAPSGYTSATFHKFALFWPTEETEKFENSAIFGDAKYDVDLTDRWQEMYYDIDIKDISQIWLGPGVVADITYYATDITYSFEAPELVQDVSYRENNLLKILMSERTYADSVEHAYMNICNAEYELAMAKRARWLDATKRLAQYNKDNGIE